LSSIAFMGLPCPRNSTGMRGLGCKAVNAVAAKAEDSIMEAPKVAAKLLTMN
jgi:hypothetical protein